MSKTSDLTDYPDVSGLQVWLRIDVCTYYIVIVINKSKCFKRSICIDTELSDFHSLVCTATKDEIKQLKLNKFKCRSYNSFDNASFFCGLSVILFDITEILDDVNDSY